MRDSRPRWMSALAVAYLGTVFFLAYRDLFGGPQPFAHPDIAITRLGRMW